jgi:ATP-binding cassette subfamily B protein
MVKILMCTISYVVRIIMLNRGRIVEGRSHAALMIQDGHYAQLYNTYFRHQSSNYKWGRTCTAHLRG